MTIARQALKNGKRKKKKARVIDLTGKTLIPPLKKGDRHQNFQPGGIYAPKED